MLRILDMAGRRAVVTGSSSGIGAAVAAALRDQGVSVWGLDVAPPPAAAPAAPAAPPPPAAPAAPPAPPRGSFTHVPLDLRDAPAVDAVARDGSLPRAVDYLVNVAGIDPKFSIADGGPAEWDAVVGVNLRGQYLLTRALEPALIAGAGKAVVNVSSINFRLGVRGRSIYTASKAGILGLTRGVARELGAHGIRVNTVSPGWVFTDAQRAAYFDGPDGAKHLAYLASVQSLPAARIAPADIAAVVTFLLSSSAAAVTGSNLVADAGWLLE
jgi:D-xylose 1-dehydrogenase